ncbi:MAG: hypothetical protein JSV41_08150 [Gemmatimonadota bacterium]|nr:MAG: hypothetical protein JSV41_08150 [Gemmatimonadota bacterium]
MTRTGVALVLAYAAVISALACSEGRGPTRPEPMPGELLVAVVSPNGAEGAAVLETVAEGIVEAAAEDGDAYVFRAGNTSRIVVLLNDPSEIRFTLWVEDIHAPPALRIVEVADGENRLRATLSGYRVEVEPASGP